MKQINAIYAMHSIDGLAGSLIGIFIPIYLLSLNYSLPKIFTWLLIYGVLVFFFFLLTGVITDRIGLKNTIIIRFPFLFAYLLLLFWLDKFSVSFFTILLLSIFSALQVSLYWFPLHCYFTLHHEENATGKSVGRLFAFPEILNLLTPLIGGALTVAYGFKALFGVSILLHLFSVFPLLKLAEIKTKINFKLSRIKELFSKYPKYFFAEFFENIGEEVSYVILPIFIFLLFNNVLSVGAFGTFSKIGSILFILLIGQYSDRYNKKTLIKVGSVLLLTTWVIRYFTDSQTVFFITAIITGFFTILIMVPFNTIIYSTARKDKFDDFIIFREIPVALARISIYSLCLLAISNIKLTFLIASFSYIYFFFF
jgi:MFS family permease